MKSNGGLEPLVALIKDFNNHDNKELMAAVTGRFPGVLIGSIFGICNSLDPVFWVDPFFLLVVGSGPGQSLPGSKTLTVPLNNSICIPCIRNVDLKCVRGLVSY